MRKATHLEKVRIFVAHPSDLTKERRGLDAVAQSLQRVAEHCGVTLDLTDWHDAVPHAGQPEKVILSQLRPATWDVFIGMLWCRFGTPTGARDRGTGIKYMSGTEQEFYLAYRLWKRHGRPQVSFYRCERKQNPDDFDPKQFRLVKKFFRQLAADGANPSLYHTFKTVRSFEELVRRALTDILLKRRGTPRKMTNVPVKGGQPGSAQLPKLVNHSIADILGSLVLRGVKETYYRTLDKNMGHCPEVRINVMAPNPQKHLAIRFVDDPRLYTRTELAKTWKCGDGKCGAAWKENTQQIYASDSDDPERFLEPMGAFRRTKLMELQSVVSTPVRQGRRTVGILNFDSKFNSTVTKIQEPKIRNLLSRLAGQTEPLLSSRRSRR